MKGVATILFSTPGPKMIWQFGEIGYDYSINYNQSLNITHKDYRTYRKPIINNATWNSDRGSLYSAYSKICKLRHSNYAAKYGTVEIYTSGLFKIVYRKSNRGNLIYAANFEMEGGYKFIKFPKTGTWYEVISGEKLRIINCESDIWFDAGASKIYSDRIEDTWL